MIFIIMKVGYLRHESNLILRHKEKTYTIFRSPNISSAFIFTVGPDTTVVILTHLGAFLMLTFFSTKDQQTALFRIFPKQ
jgi:hypothetical protein